MRIFLISLFLFFKVHDAIANQEFVPLETEAGKSIPIELQRRYFDLTGKNPEKVTVWVVKTENGTRKGKYVDLNAVRYPAIDEKKAIDLVRSNIQDLEKSGYIAYSTNFDFKLKGWVRSLDLVVAKGYDKFDILKIYNTSGSNNVVSNDLVVSQIRDWEEKMELVFDQIDEDMFGAYIVSFRYDYNKLADENIKLCPDVIDQGYGSREKLIEGLKERELWCWWD